MSAAQDSYLLHQLCHHASLTVDAVTKAWMWLPHSKCIRRWHSKHVLTDHKILLCCILLGGQYYNKPVFFKSVWLSASQDSYLIQHLGLVSSIQSKTTWTWQWRHHNSRLGDFSNLSLSKYTHLQTSRPLCKISLSFSTASICFSDVHVVNCIRDKWHASNDNHINKSYINQQSISYVLSCLLVTKSYTNW